MLAPYSAAVPFLPLLYVAWADGELTRAEIESTQAKLAGQSWPEKGAHEALLSWLRPGSSAYTQPASAAIANDPGAGFGSAS